MVGPLGLDMVGMLLVSVGAALLTATALMVGRGRQPRSTVPPESAVRGQIVDLVVEDAVCTPAPDTRLDLDRVERRLDDLARRVDRIASLRRGIKS